MPQLPRELVPLKPDTGLVALPTTAPAGQSPAQMSSQALRPTGLVGSVFQPGLQGTGRVDLHPAARRTRSRLARWIRCW